MNEGKLIRNLPEISNLADLYKTVQIGIVVSTDDPNGLGRIQVRIAGQANLGGDADTKDEELAWAFPMVSKFFTSQPKIDEAVFILTFSKQKAHSDRLYLGPIISQLDKLKLDRKSSTGLNSFTFASTNPNKAIDTVPALKGVFPKTDDISIQGRYNTDIILRENQILIRAGKFVKSQPNENNPYNIKFNDTTQGYIQIKNDIPISTGTNNETGSVLNVVANKINLLSHKDGSPRFNLMNQDDQISNEEILNILQNAHPLPFGDLLLQYLILLKNAFLNHVHNNNGIPPTDLTIGQTLPLKQFKDKAEDLENRMLSKNIRIN